MNLHDLMREEISSVFLNLNEFATRHEINGRKISCIVDTKDGEMDTASSSGFINPAGIGILQAEQTVHCSASELGFRPLSGEKIVMDGDYWIIGGIVEETEGLLTISMRRAY